MQRLGAILLSLALGLGVNDHAEAFSWPTVSERIERDLEGSQGVETRRLAAEKLADLGRVRAAPLVLKALADDDLEVRLLAARAAAHLRLSQAAEVVIAWLGDPDPSLRLAACELLLRVPTVKASAALSRALSDHDAKVRLAALLALAELDLEDFIAALLGKLEDPNERVRREAIRALARAHDDRALFSLVGKIGDGAGEVRLAAVEALGQFGHPRAANALMLALRDRSVEVRVAALRSLGQIRAEEATSSIISLLDAGPEERRAALLALSEIASDEAIEALLGALDDEDPNSPEVFAQDALVALGPRIGERLLGILEKPPSPNGAGGAALALSRLETKGAARSILDAMDRGRIEEELALRALANLRDSSAIPAVLATLDHPRAVVRGQALLTLQALLDPRFPDGRAVGPLIEALGRARISADERKSLIATLGRTGSPQAIPALARFSKSPELSLRLAAIDALGVVGPHGQDEALFEALRDERPSVRLRAGVALASSASDLPRLLDELASAAEADRGAIGIAVSGAMARNESAAVAKRAVDLLKIVSPSARDAVLEGLGRMRAPAALDALVHAARSANVDDRRKTAEALAGHSGSAAILVELLGDSDAGVRAAAAWSVGSDMLQARPYMLWESVSTGVEDGDGRVAANAIASLARLALREVEFRDRAIPTLCGALEHPHGHARTNALTGLRLLQSRCEDGSKEREVLHRDPTELVRVAAAMLLRAVSTEGPADSRALGRCASGDKSAMVAAKCRGLRELPITEDRAAVSLFIVPDGATAPAPRAAYSLLFANHFVRSGHADRRGAVLERAAPAGPLELVASE